MDVTRRPSRLLQLLPLGIVLSLAGCAGLSGQKFCLPCFDRPSKGEVSQLMALWADNLVEHPDPMSNGQPTFGFAARVYLLSPGLGEALAADGSLKVTLYNGATPVSDKAVPLEVWNIDQASLEYVLTKDGLGWGYDLWLPWRTRRPEIKQARLMVQYTPKQGMIAYSSSTDLAVGRQGTPTVAASRLTQPTSGSARK